MISEATRGVFVIAATPFDESGALDLGSADRLVDFYLSHRVHGLTILGMMGEAHKLTSGEAETLAARILRRVNRRVPVIVGVSNPGIRPMREFAGRVMDLGAEGVMVAPASGLHTDEQAHAYFATAFEALGPDTPVCLQDYPQSTAVHLSVSLLERLVNDFPQFVVFKHEDCPGLQKLAKLRRSEGRRVSILVGNGGLYYPLELRRGADGAMTGFAFPEMLVGVYELFRRGEPEAAEDLFDAYLPLVRYEQQPGYGLAVRKEILRRRGAIRTPVVRGPGPSLSEDDRRELDGLLARLERRLAEHKASAAFTAGRAG